MLSLLQLKPVGVIHSPYKVSGDAPFQGRFNEEEIWLEIFDEFAAALHNVERATHLIVLHWCDKADRTRLQTRTPHGPDIQGVFACRSPSRPNPIAFCIAKLLRREGNTLVVQGVDALDKTPLLDIKPYVPDIDAVSEAKLGWFKSTVARRNGASRENRN